MTVEVSPGAAERGGTSVLSRYNLSRWDALAGLITLALVVAFAPPLMFRNWTPRMAIVLAIGPVGVYLLVRLVRTRDAAAIVLIGALLWSTLAGAVSDAPRSALLGFVGRDMSTLTVVLAAGFWAIGRQVSTRGERAVIIVLTWGATLGGAIGAAQLVANVDSGSLALYDGRPTGLLSNPVYFGAVCAAALMAAATRCAGGSWRLFAIPLLVLGIGTSISGSRVALAAVCLAMTVYCLVRRGRQTLAAAGCVVGSLTIGVLLDQAVGPGRNAASRLGESTGGRTTAWRYGIEAWLERPFTGNGLGRFRAAVQHRFSADFVRDYAPDEATQAWFDAHNVVIGLLVAVGIVGLLLFFGWGVMWARLVRGPLAWALIPIAAHWLLQPVSLFTLPLAMLLFGVAGAERAIAPRPSRTISVAVCAVGVALAALLLAGDIMLRRASDNFDGEAAARAAPIFGRDPIVGDVVAQVYASDPGRTADVLKWRRKVVEAEPDRPHWWSALARAQIDAGLFAEAEASLQRAYELQPHNLRTLRTEGRLAIAQEDEGRLEKVLAQLCRMEQPECGFTAAEVLEANSGQR